VDHEKGRILLMRSAQHGVSLIELMIGLAIVAMVLFVGVPAFAGFLQNTQIRNAAQTTLSGITLARAEALRRNQTVRFQLVSSLTSACALSATGMNWIVSLANPAGMCEQPPSETAAPQIIQAKSSSEGTQNISVATSGGSLITFNGLGRATGAAITQLDFSNTTGTCETAGGTMRCLRIVVSPGGQVKLCDPKVTSDTDPRKCP
jgi:type IV fimbrial biogenesis protein FimT